jgi:hypothetical protein
MEYEEEDDDEEGCVITTAEIDRIGDEGWRTPDDSWLDLEEEDVFCIYHVNVIINEDAPWQV